VISAVNAAFATRNVITMLALAGKLTIDNNRGCPLH
jgi:hypothetical protein